MKPIYSISVNGKIVSFPGNSALVSLTVTDETGEQADRFSLRIEDVAGAIELPKKGVIVSIRAGLFSLSDLGTFTVDTVGVAGPPDIISIDGHAAPFAATGERKGMQDRKSRSFDEKTLGDIVKTIAGEHGLAPVISEDLASIEPGHVDQTDESDASLLNRLARDAGGVVKATMDKLAFVKRGASKTATGGTLATVALSRGDVSRWEYVQADRGSYKSAVATYRDHAAAETVEVVVGEGEPALRLPHVYSNAGNARRAAQSRLDDAKRASGGKLRLTMPVRLDIMAETPITVAGIRQGVDGSYVARRVEHTLDRGGFRTVVDCESPGGEA